MPGDGAMRASHTEREAIVQVLRDAYADGRLDLAELRTRAGAAYLARTWGDLQALIADLPTWLAVPDRYGARAQAPRPPARRAGRSHPPILVLVFMLLLLAIGVTVWWPATLILVMMLPVLAVAAADDRPVPPWWRR